MSELCKSNVNHAVYCQVQGFCQLSSPQRVAINGAIICRGFVTGFSRSRVRHSAAEPLRCTGHETLQYMHGLSDQVLSTKQLQSNESLQHEIQAAISCVYSLLRQWAGEKPPGAASTIYYFLVFFIPSVDRCN